MDIAVLQNVLRLPSGLGQVHGVQDELSSVSEQQENAGVLPGEHGRVGYLRTGHDQLPVEAKRGVGVVVEVSVGVDEHDGLVGAEAAEAGLVGEELEDLAVLQVDE